MANEELKIRNLNHVLQTAYEQMLSHGIENTTQVLVSKASGISKASIDRYFVNKVDCVLQTAEMVAHRENNYLWEQMNKNDYFCQSGIDKLATYLGVVKSMYDQNPRIFVLLAELKVYLYRNCANCLDAYNRVSTALGDQLILKRIFLSGLEDGSMRPGIDAEQSAAYMADFFRELLTNLAMCPNPGMANNVKQIDGFIESVLGMFRSNNAQA